MRRRKAFVPFLGLAVAGLAFAASGSSQGAPAIPDRLDDGTFWNLVVELSEPDGPFEDENYVSNELGHHRVLPRLQEAIGQGGVYLGVGPEQNFTYIAALQPKIAFVLDIRRQNMMEHLMYKALFELSTDRADFVSRLFSRPRPPGLDTDSSAQELFAAYESVLADRELYDESLASILEVLTGDHGFGLDALDRESIRKVLNAFYEGGPGIMYVFQGTAERHPTYPQLMALIDESGRNWSYLGSADSYRYVKSMQLANLIVPVVGDFAGPKALEAVGDYVRDHGDAIDVFYVSNVEPYLFGSGVWRSFYDNVGTLPLEESSLFVRTFFGSTVRECRELAPPIRTPVLGPMAGFLTAYQNGDIESQCALVERSR